MRAPDIDKPIRLGRAFLALYFALVALSLWFHRPASWRPPVYGDVIGLILLPFLAAMALYCTFLFLFSLATHFSAQRRALGLFLIAISGPVVAMVLVYLIPGLKPLNAWYSFLASALASFLFGFLRGRCPVSARPRDAQPPGGAGAPPEV